MKQVALVTGASSGIGRALAVEFASHGYDLVVVARGADELQHLADECESGHGCRVTVIPKDLSRDDSSWELVSELGTRGIPVSVLVNNAGFGVHGAFLETDLRKELEMARIQVLSLMELSKALLPRMVREGRGGILNIASVYSFSPVPFQAVYGACKAFMLSFSEALGNEIAGKGVTVTTVCPGVTRTAFRRRAGMRDKKEGAGHSAEEVARFAYRAFAAGRSVAVPGFWNRVFVICARLIPQAWVSPAVRRINQVRGI